VILEWKNPDVIPEWKNLDLTPEWKTVLDPYKLKFFRQGEDNSERARFSVAVSFPIGEAPKHEPFRMSKVEKNIITWSISPLGKSGGKQYRKVVDYFSTLPDGCIPDHDIGFFKHFLLHLKGNWLKLCDLGKQHLTNCVS